MILSGHFDSLREDFCDAVENFDITSRQAKLAAKTAFACILSLTLTMALRIDHPQWAGLSALIITLPNVSAEMWKGWQRMCGACIGSLLGIFYAGLVCQSGTAFTILSFFLLTAGLYRANSDKKTGYFWIYGIFHVYIICVMIIMSTGYGTGDTPLGTSPEHTAFYRGAAVSLGVIVGVCVNLLIWPDFAFDDAVTESVKISNQLGNFLKEVLNQYLENSADLDILESQRQELRKSFSKYQGLYSASNIDQKIFFEEKLILSGSQLDRIAARLYELTFLMKNFSHDFRCQECFRDELTHLPELLKRILIDKNQEEVKTEINAVFLRLDEHRGRNSKQQLMYSVNDIIFFRSILAHLRELFRVLTDDQPELHGGHTSDHNCVSIKVFSHTFKIDIPILKFAVKSASILLAIFWLWMWLEIPGGGFTMSVSVLAVFQMSPIFTGRKALLRFSGCLCGAAMGLFVMQLGIESWLLMCLISFVVLFFCAYIHCCRPGVSYLGLQAGIAYMVCCLNSNSPQTTTDSGVERLTGIFLGLVVIWIVNTILLPEDYVERLRSNISNMKKQLCERLKILTKRLHDHNNWERLLPINTETDIKLLNELESHYEIAGNKSLQLKNELSTLKRISLMLTEINKLLNTPSTDNINIPAYEHILRVANEILSDSPAPTTNEKLRHLQNIIDSYTANHIHGGEYTQMTPEEFNIFIKGRIFAQQLLDLLRRHLETTPDQ